MKIKITTEKSKPNEAGVYCKPDREVKTIEIEESGIGILLLSLAKFFQRSGSKWNWEEVSDKEKP